MLYVFYAFGMFGLLWEIISFSDAKRLKEGLARYKGSKYEDLSDTIKSLGCLMVFYYAWTFCGLFTNQWLVFATLILMSFIPKKLIWIRKLDSIISFMLILFAMLNEFHLKIDLISIFS